MRISNILLMVIFPTAALAEWETNMPRGVTPTSEVAYDLHMLIFYITVVIGIVVFGAMLYSIIYHRKSLGYKPAKFHESTKVEIIWTVIPFIILVGMAVPATKALIMMEDTRDSEITLKVTGYQWMWQYEYLEDNVTFFSKIAEESNVARRLGSGVDVTTVENYLRDVDHAIVLPINTKVRILLTANDVIHAWWVPELGGKKDAIPGYVNEIWVDIKEPGTYRGQCAELCGKDHGFMPIVVHAVSKPEYYKWVGIQKTNKVAKNK
jgi:cytochrome c oxidase subunit 2|tara:strand:- start:34 stop:828 length:795 start_codon:yes stop_codon:yes gene_type:complete